MTATEQEEQWAATVLPVLQGRLGWCHRRHWWGRGRSLMWVSEAQRAPAIACLSVRSHLELSTITYWSKVPMNLLRLSACWDLTADTIEDSISFQSSVGPTGEHLASEPCPLTSRDHSRGACCLCRYRFSHTLIQLETSSGQSRILTHRPCFQRFGLAN